MCFCSQIWHEKAAKELKINCIEQDNYDKLGYNELGILTEETGDRDLDSDLQKVPETNSIT